MTCLATLHDELRKTSCPGGAALNGNGSSRGGYRQHSSGKPRGPSHYVIRWGLVGQGSLEVGLKAEESDNTAGAAPLDPLIT